MSEPQVNEPVKLAQDIPELGLSCGEIGVICSTWFSPTTAYEVEFEKAGLDFKTRALLLEHQIQLRPQLTELRLSWEDSAFDIRVAQRRNGRTSFLAKGVRP